MVLVAGVYVIGLSINKANCLALFIKLIILPKLLIASCAFYQ